MSHVSILSSACSYSAVTYKTHARLSLKETLAMAAFQIFLWGYLTYLCRAVYTIKDVCLPSVF